MSDNRPERVPMDWLLGLISGPPITCQLHGNPLDHIGERDGDNALLSKACDCSQSLAELYWQETELPAIEQQRAELEGVLF